MSIYLLVLVSSVISACVLVLVLQLLFKQWRLAKALSAIPELNPIWPFGDLFRFFATDEKDYYKMYEQLYEEILQKKGPLVKLWLFNVPYIIPKSPKAIEDILKSNSLTTKGLDYDLLSPWLGNGLLVSSGKLWHSHRKLLTPSFHFRILKHFLPILNEHCSVLVDILQERVTACTSGLPPSSLMEIGRPITFCVLDIICATAMGKNIDAQRNPQSEYVKAIESLNEHLIQLFHRPWLQIPLIFNMTSRKKKWDKDLKTVHDFSLKMIEERRVEMMKSESEVEFMAVEGDGRLPVMGSKRKKVFLDILLEAAKTQEGELLLTDQDIREEVDTFMFAGHDTTAAALTWIVHFVGHEPEVQRKIQEELDGQFAGNKHKAVEMKDLADMKYLEAVIMESLRMVPPVSIFGRFLTSDTEIDGILVPAGVNVYIATYMMHKNPHFYDDPHIFRPERFLDRKENEKRHPFSFIGFSAGPRNCLGQKFAMMEMKVVLSTLFRRFHVTSVRPLDAIRKCPSMITRPLDPVDVILTSRSQPPSSLPPCW